MRFMMMMIPEVYQQGVDPSFRPPIEAVAEMAKFNKAMIDAGIVLAMDGLHPPSSGARVSFAGGKPTITDGPFTEAKELIGGYWIIQVDSKDEALAWAARCPAGEGDVIEVRQIFEMSDHPEDVQAAYRI